MSDETKRDMAGSVYQLMGYDCTTKKVGHSLISCIMKHCKYGGIVINEYCIVS